MKGKWTALAVVDGRQTGWWWVEKCSLYQREPGKWVPLATRVARGGGVLQKFCRDQN